jgi:catechol 2,3-dioxygenase-like lactoylglutathione lyase family enzyme
MCQEPASTSANEVKITSPSKLSHFVLKTSRFDEMLRWYTTVLNARVIHSDDRLAFLAYDQENHRLALVRIDDLEPRPKYAAGLDHIAFTYNDLGALLANYAKLKGLGIEPRWPVNHGMTTSFYYQDPDGNKIELQFENYPSEREVMDYIEGPVFAKNPLGGSFDPQELIAKFEAGEPIYDLVRNNISENGMTPVEILRDMDLYRD